MRTQFKKYTHRTKCGWQLLYKWPVVQMLEDLLEAPSDFTHSFSFPLSLPFSLKTSVHIGIGWELDFSAGYWDVSIK